MNSNTFTNRRKFIGDGIKFGGIAAIISTSYNPRDVVAMENIQSVGVNVKEPPYNAQGNATSSAIQNGTAVDDTTAFQNALDDTSAQGGGIVLVPTGNYLLTNIKIPANVTLQGVFTAPPAYSQEQGSTLVAVADRGSDNGTPFITLAGHNSTIRGFTIYYPEQNDPQSIVPYPWTIRGGELDEPHFVDNLSVQDILLVNPYQAIDFGTYRVGRHLIQRVYGQPLRTGIAIDKCLDVGRIEDIHFWPFWSQDALQSFVSHEGFALVLRRSDWQIVNNFFAFGYHVGVLLAEGYEGHGTNGHFINFNLDQADVGIDIYNISDYGIMMSNVNIVCGTAFGQQNRRAIWQHSNITNDGPLSIVNGSFWGEFNDVVLWEGGGGPLHLNGCIFRGWTLQQPAVRLMKGRANIQGNFFEDERGKSIYIDSNCDRIIVTGNHLVGNEIINHGMSHLTLVANNL